MRSGRDCARADLTASYAGDANNGRLGRPVQTQQPPNTGSSTPTVTGLGWDLRGGLTRVVDPRQLTTTYTVNGLGDKTAQSSPDTNLTTATFDVTGNVTASTDARGKTNHYAYDSLDRLKTVTFTSGTPITFEYDAGASPSPQEQGELTKVTDESGQTTYTHDGMGRLRRRRSISCCADCCGSSHGAGLGGTSCSRSTYRRRVTGE